jgi:hypothetical protein
LRLNARLIRSEHRDGYRTGHADDTAARARRDTWHQRRHGVRGCARAPLGYRKTCCSARPQKPASVELVTWRRAPSMRRRPSDAPRSSTPSRRATRPPASPRASNRCRPVAFPAFCDTSPGSVGQRFRPATTCAAPDVIADVCAHTLAHSLRSHRTCPMLTPRQVEAAQVEPTVSAQPKRTKQANVAGTGVARPARTAIAAECPHRSRVSAGEVEHVTVEPSEGLLVVYVRRPLRERPRRCRRVRRRRAEREPV